MSQRSIIEKGLAEELSFKTIGKLIGKDCTTVSKEIRSHRIYKDSGAYGRAFNDCLNRHGCPQTGICGLPGCKKKCCFCGRCRKACADYQKESCAKPTKPPYVCNGCGTRQKCTLGKFVYSAPYAQKEYEAVRSEAQSGIVVEKAEAERLDAIISPLVRKGQSIRHICEHHGGEIMFSEKTIYNYYDKGVFSSSNIDLPRKVKYRPRKSRHDSFKRDKACRTGRTYADFAAFMAQNPDTPIVEMDSVEGVKGGHVLLTIHFTDARLMLAFKRPANTAQSVRDIFEALYASLGHEAFVELFPLILTDNGSEFSDPLAIEFDSSGRRRTRIFYCDPRQSQQKGACENNHEFIRRIVPKGRPFDCYSQDCISLMMDHINSYARKSLGGRSPFETFEFLHGADLLKKLGVAPVPPDSVTLHPSLLK